MCGRWSALLHWLDSTGLPACPTDSPSAVSSTLSCRARAGDAPMRQAWHELFAWPTSTRATCPIVWSSRLFPFSFTSERERGAVGRVSPWVSFCFCGAAFSFSSSCVFLFLLFGLVGLGWLAPPTTTGFTDGYDDDTTTFLPHSFADGAFMYSRDHLPAASPAEQAGQYETSMIDTVPWCADC